MPPVLSSRRRTPPHAACAVWSCRRTPPHATCVVWSSSSCMHIIPSMPPPPSPSPCSGQHTALISDTSDAVMSEIFGGGGSSHSFACHLCCLVLSSHSSACSLCCLVVSRFCFRVRVQVAESSRHGSVLESSRSVLKVRLQSPVIRFQSLPFGFRVQLGSHGSVSRSTYRFQSPVVRLASGPTAC